jgi:hypothetical protein
MFWVFVVGRETNVSLLRAKLNGQSINFDIVQLSHHQSVEGVPDAETEAQMSAVLACGLRNARQHFLAAKASPAEVTVTSELLDKGINEALVAIRSVKHTL